jgi:aminoglycoside/choline kinase family phosphotransferase
MSLSHQQALLIEKMLETPAFETMMEEIQVDLFNQWRLTDTSDSRERLFHESQALERILDTIRGKLSEYQSGDTK